MADGKRSTVITILFLIVFFALILIIYPFKHLFAGTTPPVTTHEFSGTLGNNGWYTSTVDVTLRTSDLESGPKSTSYWLNSNPPTTIAYDTIQNQILNPSFEESDRSGRWPFYVYTIRHWFNNDCASCSVLFWQSSLYAKFGWRSAATGILGSGIYYWHNRDRSVNIIPGETYTVSVWVKTLGIWGTPGAWLEAWAKGSGDWDTDLKLGETNKVTGNTGWTLLSYTFVAPADYSQFYVRLVLQDSGFIGVAWWDGVSMYGGTNFYTNFLVIENRAHNLYYYSKDNNNNTESVHQTSLKIDTIAPQDWNDFDVEEGTNDHTFKGIIHVKDVTSGLDISETYYAYYTNHQDEEWDHNGDGETDWYPVESVSRIPSGQPAYDGITEEVEIKTPFTDFGDSSTVMKFQFRAQDMAGNTSNSPIMTIAGAWSQSEGQGDIYVKNGIDVSSVAPEGEYNTDSIISVGNTVLSQFISSSPYVVKEYNHSYLGTLVSFFPNYDEIRNSATSLPGDKMPENSGIYYYTGDYTLDQNSLTPGFESGTISTVIIIEGNLTIEKEFEIAESSQVVFLVTGNIEVEGTVEEISGYFFAGDTFNSNIDAKEGKQLTIQGSIMVGNDLILSRDLGRKGNPNNSTTPSEYIEYMRRYLFDNTLSGYLGGSQIEMNWLEQ